ncbi:kinase-like domain, phloem protein 2-like protein, partial [Tanacetum coccineum]
RIYTKDNKKGIAPIARHRFENGTLMEIVDHKIKEEADGHVFSLSKGPNKDSLDIFSKIAYRCLVETQAQRPTIDDVIHELKRALQAQEKSQKENLKMSLKDIKSATQNFSDDNIVGRGGFGNLYKGEASHANGHTIIAAKRLDRRLFGHGEAEFFRELDIPMKYKHENVIGLGGYCDEEDEKIIVHEFSSRGSLDGDIKSSNILLFDDWKAKITGFGLSLVCPINQDIDYVTDNAAGTIGYSDPLYMTTRLLTKEYDIFSLGAVLFDILCGKLSSIKLNDEHLFLPFLAKNRYQVGKLDELVFEGIKEQIYPQSFDKFARIAYQCLHHRRERRPTAHEVVIELKEALEIQEDHELWEPKLPKDYKEIIKMSRCPEIYSTKKKEELYNIFSKGILLQQDKVLLSFDGKGERNEMVSATMFIDINRCLHERKSLQESRFETVVEILDNSDMNIEIKTRAQFLSPGVVYGVYLVFKLCDSRKFSTKPMYVNLKYRKGHESLHAYFATWRDEQWMMIELHRFLNQNEDVLFEFLLENFSSYYFGDAAVYVEGIEFRVIDKVKYEGIGKSKEVQQVLKSNFDVDRVRQLPTDFTEIFKINRNYEELFWLGNMGNLKLLIVSAKAALQNVSNERLFTSKSSTNSRFQEMIEAALSDKYEGLHCPVKVQDVLHHENNKAEFLYFINPSPLNIHDTTRVPKQRKDGWMEIQLWKFYSYSEFKDDSLSMNMKFTSLEGTMSGLIVCGLEFRPW